jgi:bifunctional protein folC
MTYQEALAYLEQASSFGIKPGLERITALMDVLGNPQEDYKIVHVTGTNGKGSVTSYISYALFTSGLRVGGGGFSPPLPFNPIRSVFKLMMEI